MNVPYGNVPKSSPATIDAAFNSNLNGSNRPDTNISRVLSLGIRRREEQICGGNLNAAMRKLWSDHVYWTREYILASVFKTPNKDVATQRLLKNQEDIGSSIKSVFGASAGNKLTVLLKQHILGVVTIIENALGNRRQQMNVAIEQWRDNGDEIARFLNSINPQFWTIREMNKSMRDHLDLTLKEINATLDGDYKGSQKWFDLAYQQILYKADTMTEGIVLLKSQKN